MAFHDFRDPIEYVVNQFFERKRSAASNKIEENGKERVNCDEWDDSNLPEYPFIVLKNRNGKKYKFVYGNIKALEENPDADVVIWQEELLFGPDEKTCIGIRKTFPDGREIKIMKQEENGEFLGFGLE